MRDFFPAIAEVAEESGLDVIISVRYRVKSGSGVDFIFRS